MKKLWSFSRKLLWNILNSYYETLLATLRSSFGIYIIEAGPVVISFGNLYSTMHRWSLRHHDKQQNYRVFTRFKILEYLKQLLLLLVIPRNEGSLLSTVTNDRNSSDALTLMVTDKNVQQCPFATLRVNCAIEIQW
jgi:hypothetical protein